MLADLLACIFVFCVNFILFIVRFVFKIKLQSHQTDDLLIRNMLCRNVYSLFSLLFHLVIFLNRLPFVALLFCLLAFEFYFSFPKMIFFIHFFRFTYVNSIRSIISFRLVILSSCLCTCTCTCICAYLCVKEFCCRWTLNNHFVRTHYRHTQWQHCAFYFIPIDTRENLYIHIYKHTHTHTITQGNDLSPCVCCLHSCCVVFFPSFSLC